jgi:elongation factor P
MASTTDFRNGLCLEMNNDLLVIIDFQRFQMGRGGANVRTKLKSITTGKVLEHTFSSGEKVNIARIERRPFQFLYKDDLGYHFMNSETYEQVSLQQELIDGYDFLKDGQEGIEITYHADKEIPLSAELPNMIEMVVEYTEPGLKGDTATNAMKPATLDSGVIINVPLFINQGDKIKVDTRTRSYAERVKN